MYPEASITLIPEPNKDITRKNNYRLKSSMNIDTNISHKLLEYGIKQYWKSNAAWPVKGQKGKVGLKLEYQ